jgi:NAD(P)-dependent dehydrogenase (short-subunit alcohol dehydrogenase family)
MEHNTFREDCLSDKLILISGGSGALGRVIVDSLVSHGATVCINDIVSESDVQFSHSREFYYQSDITKSESVIEIFQTIISDHKRQPDIVLCHAGVVLSSAYEEYNLEEWQKVMDLNIKGSYLLSREAVKHMKGRYSYDNPGKIIFTLSWVDHVPWPEISAYTSSKAAVSMMMKSCARETAQYHIRVNGMAPGIVGAGMAKKQWDTEPEYRVRAEKAIPLGELQSTQSVANGILFLCSNASNYMTGATLLVDGGCSLYPMI